MDTLFRCGAALSVCTLFMVTAFAQTEGETEEHVSTPAVLPCEELRGQYMALCRIKNNLAKEGKEVPTCPGNYTGLEHVYCSILENSQQKAMQHMAREKKLKHKAKTAEKKLMQSKVKLESKMLKRGMRQELKDMRGKMHDALKQKRMEMDEVKSASRKERMEMRREEGAVLEGMRMMEEGMEEAELRALTRAHRLYTEPYRGERMGVRRHMGGKVRTSRDVSKTGKEQRDGYVRKRGGK